MRRLWRWLFDTFGSRYEYGVCEQHQHMFPCPHLSHKAAR